LFAFKTGEIGPKCVAQKARALRRFTYLDGITKGKLILLEALGRVFFIVIGYLRLGF